MGRSLHAVTEQETVDQVMAGLASDRGGWVVTPNLDHMRRLVCDGRFHALIAGADLLVPDGTPLVWASRLQGTPLPERVAGSSLVTSLAQAAAKEGRSLYLLGGDPGAAEGATAALTHRFKTLRIVGFDCPPHGFDHDPGQMARIREELRTTKPDIVYVALGSPKQEQVIASLRDVLPGAWWLGVGISLSFLAGQVHRAPRWMQMVGLEWSHRLLQEPRRLARRYLVHGVPFAIRLFGSALVNRAKRAKARDRRGKANRGSTSV